MAGFGVAKIPTMKAYNIQVLILFTGPAPRKVQSLSCFPYNKYDNNDNSNQDNDNNTNNNDYCNDNDEEEKYICV